MKAYYRRGQAHAAKEDWQAAVRDLRRAVKLAPGDETVKGEICDYIQKIINEKIDGVIVNPGAYTHTSVSLRDSLLLLSVPIIEVHISDIKERESFRKTNLINDICEKSFIGHGVNGYKMGIDYLNEK